MVEKEILTKVPCRPVWTAGSNWKVCREGVHHDRHTAKFDPKLLPKLPKARDRRRTSVIEEETESVTLRDFAQASMEDLRKAVGAKPSRTDSSDSGPTIASVFMAAFWEKKRMNKQAQNREVIEELNRWLEEHGAMIDVYKGKINVDHRVVEEHHTSQKMPKLIFHPFHPYRLAWDVLTMTMLLYSLVSVPFVVAFASATSCQGNFFKQTVMWYFDFALDCIFMTDILVNFRTAYFNRKEQGKLVVEAKLIALNYVKGFFCIDLVSSMPYDVILLFACSTEDSSGAIYSRAPRIIRVIRVVRILRLLRVSRISKFMQKLRDLLRLNPGVMRLFQFITIILFVMHYNSCIFFFLGEFFLDDQIDYAAGFEAGEASWTVVETVQVHEGYKSVHDIAPWNQYIVSLYWAVTTMTTMGYGDITPVTTVEVAFTILVILQGGITFSYIVGNMANLLSRINLRQLRYRESMEQWEDFMYREHIPSDLSNRIKAYKRHLYLNPSRHIPRFAAQELSGTLLRDITAHIFRPLLSRLPTFQALDECSLTALSLALEPLQVAPHQVLYREGEAADCMYFFHGGEVQLSMLLLTEEVKRSIGACVIADPKVDDWFKVVDDRDGRGRLNALLAEGTVLWHGLHQRKHKFFRWSVTPKRKAYFGESVLSSARPVRFATVVTKTWCSIFRLKVDALHHLSSRFPALGEVMRSLRGQARPNPLKQMATKIIRAMRMKEQSSAALMVVVEAAASLPPSDYRLSRCDPYCTVQIEPPLGVESLNRTLIQFNTSFPVWNENFPYAIPTGTALHERKIKIKVYDHDATGAIDQFGLLGEGEINLEVLAKRVEHVGEGDAVEQEIWVPLWRRRRRQKETWKRLKGRDRRGAKVQVLLKWVPATGGAKHIQMAGQLVGDDGEEEEEGKGGDESGAEGPSEAKPGGGSPLGGSVGDMMRMGSSMLRGVLPIGRGRSARIEAHGYGTLAAGPSNSGARHGSGTREQGEAAGHGGGEGGDGEGAGPRAAESGEQVPWRREVRTSNGVAGHGAGLNGGSGSFGVSNLVSRTIIEEDGGWDDLDSRALDSRALDSVEGGMLDSRFDSMFDSRMLDSIPSAGKAGATEAAAAEHTVGELVAEANRGGEEVAALHDKVKAVMAALEALQERAGSGWVQRTGRAEDSRRAEDALEGGARGRGEAEGRGSTRGAIRVFGVGGGKRELMPLPPLHREHTLPKYSAASAAPAQPRSASASPAPRRTRLKEMSPLRAEQGQGHAGGAALPSSAGRAGDAVEPAAGTSAEKASQGLKEELAAYLAELGAETDLQKLEEHCAEVRRLRGDLAVRRAVTDS